MSRCALAKNALVYGVSARRVHVRSPASNQTSARISARSHIIIAFVERLQRPKAGRSALRAARRCAGRAPEKWRLCARIENEREGDHGHGAQFRREGVPGFQTHYPVTMVTSNAARASNLKYGFRRFSPPVAGAQSLKQPGVNFDPSSYVTFFFHFFFFCAAGRGGSRGSPGTRPGRARARGAPPIACRPS